jgi:hypothetical protein
MSTTPLSERTEPERVETADGERWSCEVCQRLYETWVEATGHARQDLTRRPN